MPIYSLIDAFSGAGGMTLGFVDERIGGGFRSLWAIDNDPAAIESYTSNFGDHAECGDIEERLLQGPVPAADAVIGGPPCQGFSLLNKNKEGDGRRQLWEPFMEVVERSSCRVFVIENVRWLHNSIELEMIRARAKALGFEVHAGVFNTADYGVPQARHRALVLGVKGRKGTKPDFPFSVTHRDPTKQNIFDPGIPVWRTVRDAIGDLSHPVGTEIRSESPPLDLHFGRNPSESSKKRYAAVPYGGNRFDLQKNAPALTPECWIRKKSGGTDLFGRLWWERPSVTIRTEFFKPEKGRYLHPEQDRPITHREAARLMSFPDDFKFCGSKIEIARQIGNAVPPLFAGAVAKSIRDWLAKEDRASAA
ncbi:MAG: DNA cytosine methyltransferase [Ectothiorhodospiraceae bacterium AqS1]|nr:DNA cytosine methyltransferase [Ectothiorhodospiraceae bacterium AqS1]